MTKRAVIAGINNYSVVDPSGQSNLGACARDAHSMYHLLVEAFGFDPNQTWIYTDLQASRDNILSALRYAITASQPGDVVCFYYSGHGARRPASAGRADCEKFYEMIVPASGAAISDQTLFRLAQDLPQSVVNFTAILDACHSGGMDQATDAGSKCRNLVLRGIEQADLFQREVRYMRTLVPCGIGIPREATVCDNNVSGVSVGANHINLREDPNKQFIDLAKMSLISACRANELSWETTSTGHGLMTQAFLDVVNQSNPSLSYGDMLDRVGARVADSFNRLILPGNQAYNQAHPQTPKPVSQVPQLRGQRNRMSEGFLQAWTQSK